MKKSLLVFCPLLLIGFLFIKRTGTPATYQQYSPANSAAIGCAPEAGDFFNAGPDGKFITVLPGWGDHAYNISSKNDSAQIYFNQGLSMYYSYHSREAVASFKEAAKFDSTNAMIYWGQALAMGPSYNFGYLYKLNKLLPSVMQKMNLYAASATLKEKDLIAAMRTRYDLSDTSDNKREELNSRYVAAMKPLLKKYKNDLEIKALYTDAVMLVHPWDFWYNNGKPKPWTPELVQNCKDILKKDPNHPAGHHYYIHVTEASRNPEVALASADSLIKLYPGVAHMVHMSSHEYERIGHYEKGVLANEAADRSLVIYDSLAKGLFTVVHVPHYYAVDAYCALSGGMYKAGLEKSITCRNSVKPTHEETYLQYQHMFPLFTMVRMGRWDEILNDKTFIDPQWSYAGLLNDFAQGMASVKTGKHADAEKYLSRLREKQKDVILKKRFAPYKSSPYECSIVAENILQSSILFEQKKNNEAIASIKKAILAEDSLIYAEPKIWMLPARQYLGAYLLKMGKPKEAEKIYRDDLIWNPGNGWSLVGLHNALTAQGKTKELKKIKALYESSFSKADEVPGSSVY